MRFPVISLFTSKKKDTVFLKAKSVIQSGTRKASWGLSGSAALKASLIWTDWGIVLILHESEQSPAQQDEQEWERGWCRVSSTRGCGCEPAASLPAWGPQADTPSCILEDALVPWVTYEPPHGITMSHSWSGVRQWGLATCTFSNGARKPNWYCLGKFQRGSPESVGAGNVQQMYALEWQWMDEDCAAYFILLSVPRHQVGLELY